MLSNARLAKAIVQLEANMQKIKKAWY